MLLPAVLSLCLKCPLSFAVAWRSQCTANALPPRKWSPPTTRWIRWSLSLPEHMTSCDTSWWSLHQPHGHHNQWRSWRARPTGRAVSSVESRTPMHIGETHRDPWGGLRRFHTASEREWIGNLVPNWPLSCSWEYSRIWSYLYHLPLVVFLSCFGTNMFLESYGRKNCIRAFFPSLELRDKNCKNKKALKRRKFLAENWRQ